MSYYATFHNINVILSVSLSLSITVQTTSNNVQAIVESRFEKRTKGVFVPAGGKRLLWFVDDLNMPAHDLFGSQPPLELLRFWIDNGFWYDRKKQTPKFVKVRNGILMQAGVRSDYYVVIFLPSSFVHVIC